MDQNVCFKNNLININFLLLIISKRKMGNQISQLTSNDTTTPEIQLPKAGPPGPKGDKGDQGPPGNPALLLGTADFKNAVNKSIDPNILTPKSLNLKYPGITDTEAILKLYGVDTGTTNYYLMKGGHGDNDNITIDALGNIVTNGSISEGQRLLGTPDGSGNFWMGLRGSGTEDERLAMGVNGEANTGKVKQVNIRKDLVVGTNPVKFSSGWSSFTNASPNNSEISNDTGSFKQLMLVGNTSGGGVRKVGVWDRLDVHGDLVVDGGTNTRTIDLGYLDTTREGSAGKIGYGIFDENALAIVGKGKPGEARKVHMWDDVIVDRNINAKGSVSGDLLYNRGTDFFLGTSDGGADNKGGRGNFANGMTNGRAMVKYVKDNPDGTKSPKLYLNWGGDFSGGVEISGPGTTVAGNLNVASNQTVGGDQTVGNNQTVRGRVWSGAGIDGNGGMWVDGEKRGGQFMGSRDGNSLGWWHKGDWKVWHENSTNVLNSQGGFATIDGSVISHRGYNDKSQGLTWAYNRKFKDNITNVDGPVLSGWSGGLLGTNDSSSNGSFSNDGTSGWALRWNSDGNVNIRECLTIGAKNGGGHQLCSDGTNLFIKGAGGSNKNELRLHTSTHSSIMTTRTDGSTNWFGY